MSSEGFVSNAVSKLQYISGTCTHSVHVAVSGTLAILHLGEPLVRVTSLPLPFSLMVVLMYAWIMRTNTLQTGTDSARQFSSV